MRKLIRRRLFCLREVMHLQGFAKERVYIHLLLGIINHKLRKLLIN